MKRVTAPLDVEHFPCEVLSVVTAIVSVVTASVSVVTASVIVSDPRTRYWLLVENTPLPMWTLTFLYILFVFVGPRFMKHRQPLDLKWFLVVYNLGLVGLSVYMFVEVRPEEEEKNGLT